MSFRHKLHTIIFEADTPLGKAFDIVLIFSILLSVLAVMLDSLPDIDKNFRQMLWKLEWLFTILFTIEYFFRLYSVKKPFHYAISFFGIVDFLSIAPTYLSLLVPGTQYLLVIRILRVLRIFRVLKLALYIKEARLLSNALIESSRKIIVFLFAVFAMVVILGALMYMIEGKDSGFTSIPAGVYWAVVTLTTVGYGDIIPQTVPGQILATIVMVLGYGIIAVPTGIVTVGLTKAAYDTSTTTSCPSCGRSGHDQVARHCKHCGAKL